MPFTIKDKFTTKVLYLLDIGDLKIKEKMENFVLNFLMVFINLLSVDRNRTKFGYLSDTMNCNAKLKHNYSIIS